MKIKLRNIKPNPYKKNISKGELNREQIDKIKSNISELGFFGSLPVFKKGDSYHLVSGHHRLQSLKEIYGKDYEVEAVVHDYNEDQIFRGMVVENITQRTNDFMELNENVVAIENYLNNHPEVLSKLRESRNLKSNYMKGDEQENKATSNDISYWIDRNTEDVISHDVITQNLNIYHKLDPKLREGVNKKHDKSAEERGDESLNYTQAYILSSVPREEQHDLSKALQNSREQRVREQGKLVSKYKQAPEEVKKQIKKDAIDIADIDVELVAYNQREKKKNKIDVIDTDKRIENLLWYFSFSVDDSKKSMEKAIKDLRVLDKYAKEMKDKHKAKLHKHLEELESITSKISELMGELKKRV